MDSKEKEGGAKPDLVEQAVTYVLKKSYPENCTENEKRVIRKKSKKFAVKDGEVFYKKTIKGKVRHPKIHSVISRVSDAYADCSISNLYTVFRFGICICNQSWIVSIWGNTYSKIVDYLNLITSIIPN